MSEQDSLRRDEGAAGAIPECKAREGSRGGEILLSSQKTTPVLLGALHCCLFCSGHQQPLKDLTKQILPNPHLFGNTKLFIYQRINSQVQFLHGYRQEKQQVKHGSILLQAFASLGAPQEIKADNGPAYAAKQLATFLMNWGVRHTFGISYKYQ